MAQSERGWRRWTKWGGGVLSAIAFLGAVIVLVMWLAGSFSRKVPMTSQGDEPSERIVRGKLARAHLIRVPLVEPAVGTIRAVHETAIGSKLLARVVEVNLKAGQHVHAGDILVRLDDADLRAKLEQAEAAETAAQAARAQAVKDEKRYASLLTANAVSREDYEKTATALKSAEAEVRRAQENVNEARARLDWATVRSPMDGTVIDKQVEEGDLVSPGQTLVTLFDPKRMQLVASVRESLAQRLTTGQSIDVEVEGADVRCTGTISEIVPEAKASSRAFQVKVTGPCPAGVYTGMFGRLLVPLDEEAVLVVPREAVSDVGQLELVQVVEQDKQRRRAVRTGRSFGDEIEVLSGLREGEAVVVTTASMAAQESASD